MKKKNSSDPSAPEHPLGHMDPPDESMKPERIGITVVLEDGTEMTIYCSSPVESIQVRRL